MSTWVPLGIDADDRIYTVYQQRYDIGLAGAVTELQPGEGISIGGTPDKPVVNNEGILQVKAGTGISVTGDVQEPTVNNTGVLSVTAGTGVSLSGTAASPTVNNTGVLELTAGSGVTLSGTKANYTISVSGGGVPVIRSFGTRPVYFQSSADTSAGAVYAANAWGVMLEDPSTGLGTATVTIGDWAAGVALPSGNYYLVATDFLPDEFLPFRSSTLTTFMGVGGTMRNMLITIDNNGRLTITRGDNDSSFPITNFEQIDSGAAVWPYNFPTGPSGPWFYSALSFTYVAYPTHGPP